MRVRAKVSVDVVALRKLRQQGPAVLRELDTAVQPVARTVMDNSTMMVPVGDPSDDSNLRDSGFVASAPEVNLERLSTVWIAGYSHPAAGAIHEGFHWGSQTQSPPPQWMRKAARGLRSRLVKDTGRALSRALGKFFPST